MLFSNLSRLSKDKSREVAHISGVPATAARELVDDRFVKGAVTAAGGMAAFGLPESFTRTEVVVA